MNREKKILILGASSEIGIELINKIQHEYTKILAHFATDDSKLRNIHSYFGDKIELIKADLSNKEELKRLIDLLSEVDLDDVVICNSKRISLINFHKESINEYKQRFDISVFPVIEILSNVIKKMAKNKKGKIIFILSSVTLGIPPKFQTAYITEKYALLGIMKSLSNEYADKKICINAISPDMIDTKFLSNIPEIIREQNAIKSPLKRNLTVSEVVPILKFLLSEEGNSITGQNIVINYGK